MTKRLKLFLIILLGAIAAACCAVGCKIGTPGKAELLAPYKGGHVTYYGNGGWFNSNPDIKVRDLYFKTDNVPFFDINENTDGIDVTRSGYDFTGWYLPVTDGEGIIYTLATTGERVYPLLHEDGTPVTDNTEVRPMFHRKGVDEQILEKEVRLTPSETALTEATVISSDDEIIACASWKPALKFVFKLVVEDENKTYEYDGKKYKNGDVISEMPFGKTDAVNPGDSMSVSFTGATFVANYKEKECINFVGEYKREDYENDDDTAKEIVIWSKFIDGSWTIVRNKLSTVQNMFQNLHNGKNFYIIEDLNCSAANLALSRGLNSKIEGNGHTITGIKINPTASLANGATVAPLFGKISAGASIKNVTLKDISISLKCKGELTFYAISSEVEEGATLENFTIDGVTATVSAAGGVSNAKDGDRTNWLFGGSGTDAQFLESHSGVTVNGDTVNSDKNTLTIN